MKNVRRFVVCGDNHGDMGDPSAIAALLDFCKHFKPTIRVHLGDCFDFRCLRRKASEEERRDGLGADIDAGLSFLRAFKPTCFLRGNHDERLWDLLAGDDRRLGDLGRTVADDIIETLGDAPMLPYNKRRGVLRVGHLKVIHGYHSGITAARQAALVYGSVLIGHIHAIDHYSIPGLERRMGRAVGALCNLEMEYNRAQAATLRQAHGFAYGLIFPNGAYQVWQAECVAGMWIFPSELRSFVHER